MKIKLKKHFSMLLCFFLVLAPFPTVTLAADDAAYGISVEYTLDTLVIEDDTDINVYITGKANGYGPSSAEVKLTYDDKYIIVNSASPNPNLSIKGNGDGKATFNDGKIVFSYYNNSKTFDQNGKLLIGTINITGKAEGNAVVTPFSAIACNQGNMTAIHITDLQAGSIPVVSSLVYPWEGEGTSQQPYLIKTVDDLVSLSNYVNKKQQDFRDIYFKQVNNIDLSSICGEDKDYWSPIGKTYDRPFSGNYDGSGKAVSNIYIGADLENYYRGLFGCLLYASVSNLTVSGEIKTQSSAAAGIAALIGDTSISKCTNLVNVTSQDMGYIAGIAAEYYHGDLMGDHLKNTITGCINYGTITGNKSMAGGILNNTSTETVVKDCLNAGNVSASAGGPVGGICGANGTVSGCVNTGDIISGGSSAFGIGGKKVTNCYNTGDISASRGKGYNNYFAMGISKTADVTNCYNTGTVQCENTSGDYAGVSYSVGYFPLVYGDGTATNSYYLDSSVKATDAFAFAGISKSNTEMKNADFVLALGDAFEADIYGVNDGYPILKWQNSGEAYDVTLEIFSDATVAAGGSAKIEYQGNQEVTYSFKTLAGTKISFKIVNYNEGLYKVGGVLLNNETDLQPTSDGTYSFEVTTDSNVQISIVSKDTGEIVSGRNANVLNAELSGDQRWDGETVDISWYIGHENDTSYKISTPAELMGVAALVNGLVNENCRIYTSDTQYYEASWWNDKSNGWTHEASGSGSSEGSGQNMSTDIYHYGVEDFNGKTVTLTANLDMGGSYDKTSDTWSGPNFMPIGGQYLTTKNDSKTKLSSSFCGTFDGDGHYVFNIYCDRHCESGYFGDGQSVGLIGRLGVHDGDPESMRPVSPTVKNVGVTGYIYANRSVAGIVGKTGKTAYNNENKIDEAYSIIQNCVNYARVIGTDAKGTGGVVGAFWNGGVCENCYNMGNITGGWPSGGIAGTNENTLANCYNAGIIDSTSGDNWAEAIGTFNGMFNHIVYNCWWLKGSSTDGGYFGRLKSDDIASFALEADAMKAASFVTDDLKPGYSGDTDGSINGGYPALEWQANAEYYTVTVAKSGGAADDISVIVNDTDYTDSSIKLLAGSILRISAAIDENSEYKIDSISIGDTKYETSEVSSVGKNIITAVIATRDLTVEDGNIIVNIATTSKSGGDTGGGDSGDTGGGDSGGGTGGGDSGSGTGGGDSGSGTGGGDSGDTGGGTGGGDSGSGTGGGDSGSGSGGVTDIDKDDETPANPEIIKPDVNVDGTDASVDVKKDAVDDAVKAVGSSSDKDITVEAGKGKTDITHVEVTIPKASVSSIEKNTNADLVIKTDLGDITVDNGDLSELTAGNGSDVTFTIDKNTDGSIKLNVTSGGKDIAAGKQILGYKYKFDDKVMKPLAGKGGINNSDLVGIIIGDAEADGKTDSEGQAGADGKTDSDGNASNGENAKQTIIRESFVTADEYLYAKAPVGAALSIIANGKPFSDVSDSAWYRSAVGFAVSHELFNGVSDTEFAPTKSMTRGMFVTVLSRLAGAENFDGKADFSDVESDKWYASGVAWAASKGIVNGYGDGRFGPNDEVTREQMAVIMYNFTKAMGYDVTGNASLDKFSDNASVDSWAADAMKWAVGAGIMNGNADGTLNPRGTATRAQVATIMMNYVNVLLDVK